MLQRYNRVDRGAQVGEPLAGYLDGVSAAEMKYRFGWTHPIFFSPNDPNKLFLASQYVMTSDDYGRTWNIISPDLTRNDPATEKPSGGADRSGPDRRGGLSRHLGAGDLDGRRAGDLGGLAGWPRACDASTAAITGRRSRRRN